MAVWYSEAEVCKPTSVVLQNESGFERGHSVYVLTTLVYTQTTESDQALSVHIHMTSLIAWPHMHARVRLACVQEALGIERALVRVGSVQVPLHHLR